MPDYSQGKIYCIRSSQTDDVYYGSTCVSLRQRLREHKVAKTPNLTSKKILQFEDAYIELVEEFPCNNRKELNIREGLYIQNNPCVNKVVTGRGRQESVKAYYETHKEESKVYREAHKAEIKAYLKAYREAKKNK